MSMIPLFVMQASWAAERDHLMLTKLRENKRYFLGIAMGLLTALIWSGYPVVTQLGITSTLKPADIAFIRFMVGGIILLPILYSHKKHILTRQFLGNHWPAVLLLCFGAGAPYIYVTAVGVGLSSSNHFGALVPTSMMIFSMAGSYIYFKEKYNSKFFIGIITVLSGILLIGFDTLRTSEAYRLGAAALVLGGFMWALFSLASRQLPSSPIQNIAMVTVVSMLMYSPIYLVNFGPGIFDTVSRDVILQAVYQGLLSGIVALLCYMMAIRLIGVSLAAMLGALAPMFTLILSFIFLNITPSLLEILGIAICTIGMILSVYFKQ